MSDGDSIEQKVRAIYSDLAVRPIERNCTRLAECCHFKKTGLTPFLTKGEARVAAKALRASGRAQLPKRTDGACPMLDSSLRCMIYASRPFGCRTHFCRAAGGPYERREVIDLIRRLEEIDRELDGRGPVALPLAVAAALEEL